MFDDGSWKGLAVKAKSESRRVLTSTGFIRLMRRQLRGLPQTQIKLNAHEDRLRYRSKKEVQTRGIYLSIRSPTNGLKKVTDAARAWVK